MADIYLTQPRGIPEPIGRNDARYFAERQESLSRAMDRTTSPARPFAAARMLGQVFNGGSMPSGPNLFYLTHPVQVTGAVSEGASATLTADASTTLPVLVLRGTPSVGDYLTCYSAGGRWVSEEGASGGGGVINCTPCSIPTSNLTLSWVNILSGNGSDTLTYTGGVSPIWQTGCSGVGGQNIFKLQCTAGTIVLQVFYFTSGSCPSGGSSECSNALGNPHQITLGSYTCSPFSVTFNCGVACSFLQAAGYTAFTITP